MPTPVLSLATIGVGGLVFPPVPSYGFLPGTAVSPGNSTWSCAGVEAISVNCAVMSPPYVCPASVAVTVCEVAAVIRVSSKVLLPFTRLFLVGSWSFWSLVVTSTSG